MRQLRALAAVAMLVLAGQAAAGRAQQPKQSSATKPATTYKVRAGDNLSSIAHKLHTTVDALVEANKLKSPGFIRIGQVLQLPAAKDTPGADGVTTQLSTVVVVLGPNGTQTYTVVRNDNLSRIATRFNTTVADLAKANGLKVNRALQIGQKLAIPGPVWLCPVVGKRSFTNDWGAARSGGRRHQGNDLFAPRGTPVLAPVGGVVTDGSGGLGGTAFMLAGTDGVTYYGAHLEKLTAKPGSMVAAGAQLGLVGDSGNAKGGPTHLHFQVRYNGAWVNPFPTLSRWCS
jgi:murein DD-endopeptidase MepM/ murein hydrolase activator NlpD